MRSLPLRIRAYGLMFLASLLITGPLSAQLAVQARPLIVERVDETALVSLKGNTRPEARAAYDRGAVSPSLAMPGMTLILKRSPEQQAALDLYAESLQDTGSPNYHHWLTAAQQGAQFGPAQTDIEAITNWLQSRGFTVDSIAQNRMSIMFSGTAAQVQAAFHTEIHALDVKGVAHVANMGDPQIPAALAPAVVGIQALHNFFARPLHHMGAKVQRDSQTGKWKRITDPFAVASASVGTAAPDAKSVQPLFSTDAGQEEDIAPYDLATIYNILPLWNAASPIDGKGQTIAIVGTSDINPADVTAFRAAFGLPAYASASGSTPGFSAIHPNTAPGACTTKASSCIDDLVENSLDVEWAGAVAKNANIVLVASSAAVGTAFSADPVYIGASYIVQNNTAPIVNVSYGECELGLGTAGNAGWNALWQTAAVAGISVFVSSGDSGSATCDGGDDTTTPFGAQYGLSVSGLASTPYNVAVGGTDFNWGWLNNGQTTYWNTADTVGTLANAKGYIPEATWNSTCSNTFFDAFLNTQLKLNPAATATQICNYLATGQITLGGSTAYYLVDSIGGSGGVSTCTTNDNTNVSSCTGGYAKPSWQTGVTGIPADSKRDIPDVSFFAANGFSGSSYVICVSAEGSCTYTAGTEPTGEEVGGTSVSSPIMAGVMALINEQSGAAQGFPNPVLYKIASKQTYSACSTETVTAGSTSCPFNDVDTGTIAMACIPGTPNCSPTTSTASSPYGLLTGYNAGTGFDLATGLGSLNVANVVNAYAATAAPVVALSTASLTFATTVVGTSTSAQTVTVTNTGINALNFSSVSFTGANTSSYSQTNNCTSVTTGNTCTINVIFTPQAIGALPSTLQITDNAAGSLQTVALSGTGLSSTPVATLSATSLAFAPTIVGASTGAQTVTLTNTGANPLTVTSVTLTGTNAASFTQTNTCSSVTNGNSCTISVAFAPQAVGALAATVTIADNATGSPQTIGLSGTGLSNAPIATLSPTSLAFASTVVGSATAAQMVTLTNTGAGPLTGIAVTLAGTSPTSFTETTTCASTLAVNSACTISVIFKPLAAGALSATVSVADNAAGSPQTITLTGTGTAAVVGSYSLSAGAVAVTHGSSATSLITATGANGYVGPNTVTLSGCTLATSPTGATSVPTCAITSAAVIFASGAASGTGGVVTISTTAATSSSRTAAAHESTLPWKGGAGAVALAGLLLLIPARKRNWQGLLSLLLLGAGLGMIAGCGGGSSGTGGTGSSGTTTGTYTFTITGKDTGGTSQTATLTVTVN